LNILLLPREIYCVFELFARLEGGAHAWKKGLFAEKKKFATRQSPGGEREEEYH